MRRTLPWGLAVVGAVVAFGRASAEDRPASPAVDRVTLDYRGGYGLPRPSTDPYVEVRADGRLRAAATRRGGTPFEARIPADEARALVAFVVDAQRFFEIASGGIQSAVEASRKPGEPALAVPDASETVVVVEKAGRRHEVALRAHALLVELWPTVEALARFGAVVDRIENVHAVARAGGAAAASALVAKANEALEKERPKATPFPVFDLRYLGEDPALGRRYRVSRREPKVRRESRTPATTTVFVDVGKDGALTTRVALEPER